MRSRSLRGTLPEWKELVPDFTYHGQNCYALLLGSCATDSLSARCKHVMCARGQAGGEIKQGDNVETWAQVLAEPHQWN